MRRLLCAGCAVSASLLVACSGDMGGTPLGGPYGGSGDYAAPTNGDPTMLLDDAATGPDTGSPPPVDGGDSPDTGFTPPPVDAGYAPIDAGYAPGDGSVTTGLDAGFTPPPFDAGYAPVDSSVTVGPDTGSAPPPPDASTKPPPDSGSTPPPVDAGPSAPTWTSIFTKYLARGTKGNCTQCHSQMSSASAAYSYLSGTHQISGTSSAIISASKSDLSWYGGNMPPGGPRTYPAAAADLAAWVAAGAPND